MRPLPLELAALEPFPLLVWCVDGSAARAAAPRPP